VARFRVDTHVFRELGAHLVGRPSTALVELIKNSYDADATIVTVEGVGLDRRNGSIVVTDDGNGMTPELFESGFLTVASRSKDVEDRRSPRFRRRYTGAKGIGRLATHKLAGHVTVTSRPRPEAFPDVKTLRGVSAVLDWNEIERHTTLDDVGEGVVVEPVSDQSQPFGTQLTLGELRSPFSSDELLRFVTEVTTFEPPAVLVRALPDTVVDQRLIFDEPEVREAKRADSFELEFRGDFAAGDDFWQLVGERTHWVLEIRAGPRSKHVEYVIAPTKLGLKRNPYAERREFRGDHPAPGAGPAFSARILISETGRFGRDSASAFAKANTGVRVYMEGFRVLPYGDRGDDWLALDADYTRRRDAFDLSGIHDADGAKVEGEALYRLSSSNFFGGVFLREAHAGNLEMLVNREGFLPSRELDTLRRLVRQGADLVARVRAGASERKKAADRQPNHGPDPKHGTAGENRNQRDADSSTEPRRPYTPMGRLDESLNQIGVLATSNDSSPGAVAITEALRTARSALVGLRDDQALFRTLATLGTQFSAFVHEINLLLNQARFVRRLARESQTANDGLEAAADELVELLERQAAFLADLVGSTARTSRRVLDVHERLASAMRLVGPQISRRGIAFENDVPATTKTPAMFPAELTAILANLLSNAVKAAGEGGRIRLSSEVKPGRGGLALRLENTGVAVDLRSAEQWFLPFESTTTEIDQDLGVGLGLGLPIVRRLVEEYGGEAHFVEPSAGFATAVEVRVPHSALTTR